MFVINGFAEVTFYSETTEVDVVSLMFKVTDHSDSEQIKCGLSDF